MFTEMRAQHPEIRPIFELSDLLTPEQEARLRLEVERLGKKS